MLIHETWPVEKLVEYARNPGKRALKYYGGAFADELEDV